MEGKKSVFENSKAKRSRGAPFMPHRVKVAYQGRDKTSGKENRAWGKFKEGRCRCD